MSSNDVLFWDAVDRIRDTDPRYRREAYGFVVGALGLTVQRLPAERLADPERRHLSGGELVDGIVALARREFGAMAATVFEEWGVRDGEDLGHIVFQLVACGELSARPEDTLDDFRGGVHLAERLSRDLEPGPLLPRPARRHPVRGGGEPAADA
jgi:uncharacterized repeat protein (TIGR04138 family)